MAERTRYSYCSAAFLWRELAYLRANRERIEEISLYHERRREILKTLAARSGARKAA
jgi:hypothetical protein